MLLALAVFGLLSGPDDMERIRNAAAAGGWEREVVSGLERAAREWPAPHVRQFGLERWELPPEGSGWSHAYVCPEHGLRLRQQGRQNLCPLDGKDFHGWPWDNVAYMQRNSDNARAARDLGLACRLTGNADYAAKARTILNAYAAVYPALPVHDNNNRRDANSGARVMSQTLSEAVWLIPVAFAYDLVKDTMSAADRARVETDLLRNAAQVIAKCDRGKSNWQTWHNAALLAAGLALGDHALVSLALDGPSGFKFQTRASITADGPWYEGAWGYHFYSLEALLLTREMAARAGIPLPEAAALKRMLDAPASGMFPDGTLPNFNDSGNARLSAYARLYDTGYRIFGDPRYPAIISGASRGLENLLWGAGRLPSGAPPAPASEVLRDAGIATLRAPGSDHTLAVKFGPHGGGHGHFDKLSFVSFAHGTHLAADPGTQAYAAKTHATWDKTTVAHNTVVVDERTQSEATGKLLDWVTVEGGIAIRMTAGQAYAGVELERTLVHTARYTLDVFEARATDGKLHSYDWIYHNYGRLSPALGTKPYDLFPSGQGYQHLTAAAGTETAAAWQADFLQSGCNMRLSMLGVPGTTVVFGAGLGPDLRVPVPFAMARRRGTSARFAALYEPYTKKPAVTRFAETAPGVFAVESGSGRERIEKRGRIRVTRQ